MGKIDNIFQKAWLELIKMYREDWKLNIEEYGKNDSRNALRYLPKRFYSEADVEVVLSCILRNKLSKEKYYKSKYIVRNQVRFGTLNYSGVKTAEDIKIMRKNMGKNKVTKKNFIPDIVIDTDTKDDDGPFLLFAELTYWPSYQKRYNSGIPKRINILIEKAKEEAKTLTSAIDAGVLKSGYICIISDELLSIEGALELMENLKVKYDKINFVLDGMSLSEKEKILDSQS